MRKDMDRVVVSRPRKPGYERDRSIFHGCLEDLPTTEPMFRGYGKCEWNRQTALTRFIEKNIGRKWDDVYSEICEQFDHRSNRHYRFLKSLEWLVELHVIINDSGVVCYKGGRAHLQPLYPGYCYVHPVNGILCRVPEKKQDTWKNKVKRESPEHIRISETEYNLRINGNWFWVRLATRPPISRNYWPTEYYTEEVLQHMIPRKHKAGDKMPEYHKLVPYDVRKYCAVEKRQLSKKEIKNLRK